MAQKETIANLEAKLAQARRLLQGVSDQTTTKSIQGFIADLENRIRNLEEEVVASPSRLDDRAPASSPEFGVKN